MLSVRALALGLLLCWPLAVSAQDPKAPTYRLDLEGSTKQLERGEAGRLQLRITPATGYKVSSEAPLKISLQSKGIKLAKTELGHADRQEEDKAVFFRVGFDGTEAGEHQIGGEAIFFVCSEQSCDRKKERFVLTVNVGS